MWQQIVIAIVLNLVSSLLTAAAQPKPKKPEAGTLEAPTAKEGGGLKVVFGTILIKDPVVTWSGNQLAVAIRKKGGKK